MENELDDTYKDLVQNEMIFIRKKREKIASNAKMLYKQKAVNDTTAGYVKSALDYQALEVLCDLFKEYKMNADVNRWNNSIRFIASQDASKPLRTFVLGGFCIF